MARTIQILAVLLVLQLLLALGLSFIGPDLSAHASQTTLLSLSKDQPDKLIIEGPDNAKVVLAKVQDAWRLPEDNDFPADTSKVAQLIDRLRDLKLAQPVATTPGALERFKVSDSAFERRITLADAGKTLATVYLGSSLGLRQTHLRRADQDAVFVANLAIYEMPVKAQEWENKNVLQHPRTDIEGIDVAALHLARMPETTATEGSNSAEGGPSDSQDTDGSAKGSKDKPPAAAKPSWQATGLAGSERLNVEAADKLADLLAELRIGAVLGRDEKPSYGLRNPVLSLAVTRKGGNKVEYRFGKIAEKEEAYVLKTSSRPEYFRIPAYTARPLLDAAKHAALVAAPAATGKSAEKMTAKQQAETRNK